MKYLHLISEIKLYNTDNEIITIFIEIIHIQTPVRPQYQAEGGQQYAVDPVVEEGDQPLVEDAAQWIQ